MPDEIEVPLDDAQDRVIELHKERHHVGEAHHEAAGDAQTSWTRYVGVATALLAVIAAIGALQAGRLVNESLLQKNEQVGKLTAASDTRLAALCDAGHQRHGARRVARERHPAQPAMKHPRWPRPGPSRCRGRSGRNAPCRYGSTPGRRTHNRARPASRRD